MLKSLHHKNIVSYYGSKYEGGYYKIYMEYVDGGSLKELINSTGPLIEEIASSFTKQLLEGLEYLHSHKIIHRDIKCANVLVDRKGRIKLSDFGCSRKLLKTSYSYYGTNGWIAPEILQG